LRAPFSRRAVLAGSGAALLGAGLARCGVKETPARDRLLETRLRPGGAVLHARPQHFQLAACTGPTPSWLYGDEPFPVLRMKRGDHFAATLINGLSDHTTIHWHGVRLPNAMDGVPYVTQRPVSSGQRFLYDFPLPDAGVFFFHPHCDTAQQLGRGLVGVLIVDDGAAYDDDVVCVLKDWRVKPDGDFLPFVTDEGAGKAGSFGTVRTVNGKTAPVISVPAGADLRLRVLNVDSTRVSEIGVEGAEAHVIAIDGNALEPFALESWRLGPAMRAEFTLRTPDNGEVKLVDYFAAQPVTLATLRVQGVPKRRDAFTPAPLPKPDFPEPDLTRSRKHQLRLSASAQMSAYVPAPIVLPNGERIDMQDSLCLSVRTFWALDGKPWPERGHEAMPPPLLDIARGETLEIEFLNTTPHPHPMHLHGHVFKVLSASKMKRPVHWADTVLVLPDERVRIAFVADNPGNWMLHCHIIEHQDTGMMGWFRVS